MNILKANVGRTTIWGEEHGGESQIRRQCPKKGGYEFANFNRSNEESIKNACKYVGSPKQEVTGILRRYGFNNKP